MTEQPQLQRFRLWDLEYVRPVLVELYLECYAAGRDSPFYTSEHFLERLTDHAQPGWEAVVGYSQGHPIGYSYGCPLPADTVWWDQAQPGLPPDVTAEDGGRTFAVLQLMVRADWRGTGLARRLHNSLVDVRRERRLTLLVDDGHAKVGALYEQWGYKAVAHTQPYSNGPVYKLMLRDHDPSPSLVRAQTRTTARQRRRKRLP